jgi:hypothetical protein
MQLEIQPTFLAICRLESHSLIPSWAFLGEFFSISKSSDELSIVCNQENIPEEVKAERDWRCLKVQGPLDFGLTGILASLATPLAAAHISIFALSTFDTDYLLVKQQNFEEALQVLSQAGHQIIFPR